MTQAEIAVLLSMAAAYDARTIGEMDVIAWHAVLDGTPFADAQAVVVEHYRRTRDRIMPVDVVTGVKAIRARRLDGVDLREVDADPDRPAEYVAALRQERYRVASGLTPHDVRPAIDGVFRRPQ